MSTPVETCNRCDKVLEGLSQIRMTLRFDNNFLECVFCDKCYEHMVPRLTNDFEIYHFAVWIARRALHRRSKK
jgi:transcription elongation factor Elf1